MKYKKLKLTAVALLGVMTLAGCSGGSDVVTMKGGKISETEFFDKLKSSPTSSDTLFQMILSKVVSENYGDKVDAKEVDEQYNEYIEQYGGKDAFEAVLKQNNMSTKEFKESIKESLAYNEMLKAHIEVSDNDLKEAWKSYHPKVDAQIMEFDSKEKAEAALKKVKDGEEFAKVVKSDSMDEASKANGGTVTFDSTNVTEPANIMIPDSVKEAAYKLEDGKVSDVLTAQNPMTGADSFFVVKMIKNQKKGDDYKPFKEELTAVVEETKMADPTFQQEVIGKELEKANIKIQDDKYKDILTPYLPKKAEKTDDSANAAKDSEKAETTDSSK